jgi:hypothetical protein
MLNSKKRFDPIIEKYVHIGISIDNIEYAIESVKEGAKRQHILDNLTGDHRGMNIFNSMDMLDELFEANGGEFKKENRGGYLFAALFFLIGFSCMFYIFYVLAYGGVIVRPLLVGAGALIGIFGGAMYFVKSLLGKYRDEDEPFKA